MPTTLSKRLGRMQSKPIVSAVVFLAVAVLIVLVVILPSVREIQDVNERIRTQRRALEFLYKQGQSFRIAAKEYETVKKDVPFIETSYFELGEELAAITGFEAIATRVGVEQAITLDTAQSAPIKGQADTPYRRVLIRLDMVASFNQLIRILKEIETLPQYVNVLNVAVSSDERGIPIMRGLPQIPQEDVVVDAGKKLRASISAATYWKEPTEKVIE